MNTTGATDHTGRWSLMGTTLQCVRTQVEQPHRYMQGDARGAQSVRTQRESLLQYTQGRASTMQSGWTSEERPLSQMPQKQQMPQWSHMPQLSRMLQSEDVVSPSSIQVARVFAAAAYVDATSGGDLQRYPATVAELCAQGGNTSSGVHLERLPEGADLSANKGADGSSSQPAGHLTSGTTVQW
jgi:hypothetical protein